VAEIAGYIITPVSVNNNKVAEQLIEHWLTTNKGELELKIREARKSMLLYGYCEIRTYDQTS
jgi:hypothetical protein